MAGRAAVIGRLRALAARRASPRLDELLRRQRGRWRGGATFVLSFDVELRADCASLPAVLELLAARGIPASFACIGAWIDAFPAEHAALVSAGHELLDHTQGHPWHDELGGRRRLADLGEGELREEVRGAAARIRRLGASVLGFRTPHFGAQHAAWIYPVLRAEGLRYSSSTVAARTPHGGAPYVIDGVVEFPLLTCPRHPADLLDSWHCTTAPDAAHRDPEELVRLYRDALAAVRRAGAFASVYWDPRVALLPGYGGVLDEIARSSSELRLARYGDLVPEVLAATP